MFPKKYFENILLAILLIALSPYFYLSFFAHPIADDYSYSYSGMNHDIMNELKDQYFGWNGRYFSNLLVLVNPLVQHNFFLYKFFPVLLICFFLVSICFFLRAVTHRAFSRKNTLLAGMLLLMLYFFQMPSLPEGLYWYTGSVSYLAGICVSLFYFGLLADYFNGKYFLNKYFHFSFTISLILIAAGFNEVLTLLLSSFHFIVIGSLLMQREKIRKEWWIFLLVCFCGAFVMALAPGNAVRFSLFNEQHNFIRSASFTFMQMFRFGFDWISSLPFIFSSGLLMYVSAQYKENFYTIEKLNPFKPVVGLLFLLWILIAGIFPAYWQTNILGQHRTVNIACFFFLLYWFIFISSYACRHSEKIKTLFVLNHATKFIAVLLIIISMAVSKNGYDLCTDILSGRVHEFDFEMTQREEALRNETDKNRTIYFKPLSVKPKSIFVLDLTNDSLHWLNRGQAEYFGVKAIVCKE